MLVFYISTKPIKISAHGLKIKMTVVALHGILTSSKFITNMKKKIDLKPLSYRYP